MMFGYQCMLPQYSRTETKAISLARSRARSASLLYESGVQFQCLFRIQEGVNESCKSKVHVAMQGTAK